MDQVVNRAVFLDRDGTLNEDVEYLASVSDIKFIDGAVEACKKLQDMGFLLIIISNQSGVARGYFDEAAVDNINKYINELLKKDSVEIKHFYYCPHHPDYGTEKYRKQCNCRKPAPGLIMKAVKDYNISIQDSILIGDKVSDIETARNSNISKYILVRTGKGKKAEFQVKNKDNLVVCDTLLAAADFVEENYPW